MLKKRASSKKRRWIVMPIAGVVTAAIVAGTLYNSAEVALARPSLPGIEEIVQNNSKDAPFKILELVADKSDAKIGFLVDGQEPAYINNTGHGANNGKVMSIDDMASKAERTDRFPGDATTYGGIFPAFNELRNSAFTWDDTFNEGDTGSHSRETFGQFVANSAGDGDYKGIDDYSGNFKHVVANADSDHSTAETDPDTDMVSVKDIQEGYERTTGILYQDIVNFEYELPDGTADRYALTFSKVADIDVTTDPSKKLPYQIGSAQGFEDCDILKSDGTVAESNPYFNSQEFIVDNKLTGTHVDAVIDSDGVTVLEPEKWVINDDFSLGAETTYLYTVNTNGEYEVAYVITQDATSSKYLVSDISSMGTPSYYLDSNNWDDTFVAGYSFTAPDYTTTPVSEPNNFAKFMYGDGSAPVEYYTIKGYDSNIDYEKESDRLYISAVVPDNTNGCYSVTKSPKTPVLYKGEDPGAHNIDGSDISYHTYFYIPLADATNTYAPPTGNLDFVQNYADAAVEKYYYTGGFYNKEWFKQYVLDVDAGDWKNVVIDVETKLYSEATPEDIEEYDLIYISYDGTTAIDASNSMNADTAKALVKSVKDDKPIVVEAGKLMKKLSLANVGQEDLTRAVYALCQTDVSDTAIDKVDTEWASVTSGSPLETAYLKTTFNAGTNASGSYVNRSIFVVGETDEAISKDFVTAGVLKNNTLKIGTVEVSFQPVLDDIAQEIFYLKAANKDTKDFNDVLSAATVIRYILNYGDKRIVSKDKINVLDIEPYYSQLVEDNMDKFVTDAKFRLNSSITSNDYARDLFNPYWFAGRVTNTITKEDIATIGKNNKVTLKDYSNKLTVTHKGIKEFVGSVQDLNASYDLIYIGLDKQYLNLETKQIKNPNAVWHDQGWGRGYWDPAEYIDGGLSTVYNDSSMNGKLYTHFGDKINVSSSEMGLTSDYAGDYRMSGLDLTFEKTRDLEEYIEAGYAVILSDEFFKNEGGTLKVNTDRISNDSYMYRLGQFILGNEGKIISPNSSDDNNKKVYYGANVMCKAEFDKTDAASVQRKSDFASYMSIAKLSIDVTSQPTPYLNPNSTDTNPIYQYMSANNNGEYVLEYNVELKNNSEFASSTYDCVLYVDNDADGRYEELEGLRDVTNIEEEGGSSAPIITVDGETRFALETGKKYHITANAEGFVGYVPWKLVFTENGRDNVRSAVEGACAIPNTKTVKPTIHVLQLTSGNSTGDIKQHNDNNPVSTDWVWYGTSLDLANDPENNNVMWQLYQQVQDFNIDVTKVSIYDFLYKDNFYPGVGRYTSNTDRTKAMMAYLNNFDIVVMGFAETYYIPYSRDYGNNTEDPTYCGMYALRSYILSGNSMLFTHDLTTNQIRNEAFKEVGWFANRYLRDVQGMDRFGVIEESDYLNELSRRAGMGQTYSLPKYDSVYDNGKYNSFNGVTASANMTGERGVNTAVTTTRLLRYASDGDGGKGNKYGEVSAYKNLGVANDDNGHWDDLKLSANNKYNGGNNSNSVFIRSINHGQITEYPFNIPQDTDIVIANTHGQYFQLNLDTDSRDLNFDDDVVVWYTISNQSKDHYGYYTMNYNDARNNYYIFNKGNITYTGAGHAKITGDAERKLFINTLVAAYKASAQAPKVSFRDKADKNSGEISAIYEPYDAQAVNDDGVAEGGIASEKLEFNFKVVNNSLQNTAYVEDGQIKFKNIYAQYYVEVPEGTPGSIKMGIYNVKVIPLDAITITKRVDKNGNNLAAPIELDPQQGYSKNILESNCIYSVKVNTNQIANTSDTVSWDWDSKTKITELNKHNYRILVRVSLEQDGNVRGNMTTSLDNLPEGTDSIAPLTISFTDLYELK